MNNKGFTMIELLASMVLLSILMLTAVPTVLGVMDDSRKNTVVNDARKFVSNVEYKLKHNNNYIKRPRVDGQCIVITLGYLDLGSEFKEGPHGGEYSLSESYVVVKYKGTIGGDELQPGTIPDYDYYVTLTEEYDNSFYGLFLLKNDKLLESNAKKFVDGFDTSKLIISGNKPWLSDTPSGETSGPIGCTAFHDENDIYDSDDALKEQNSGD